MARSKGGPKATELLERLKHENRLLKRQLSALRKQLQRVNLDEHGNLKKLVDKHERQDIEMNKKQTHSKMRREYGYRTCSEGYMLIVRISRQDGDFFFRRCSDDKCSARTVLEPWNDEVKGPHWEDS